MPAKGIVWEIPDDLEVAERDLREMHLAGVEAVRTGIVSSEALLLLADSLGIQFYQELPIEHLPARLLLDTLDYATGQLDEMLIRSNLHSSARHFGLARTSDTTDSLACIYFNHLVSHVRQYGPAGSQVYYLSVFPEHEQCAGYVDFVLINALDSADPFQLLTRWNSHQDTNVGFGALGTWIRPDTLRGLNVPHSWEHQARYLEDRLKQILTGQEVTPLTAVFVYRWRDIQEPFVQRINEAHLPFSKKYGLHTMSGGKRLSFDVLKGFYSGTQYAFAFEGGRKMADSKRLPILLGWLIFAALGVYYTLSLRFRNMIPRYFRAHQFYKNAVREGRNILLGTNTVILLSSGLGWGTLVYICIDTLQYHEAFVVLMRWLSEGQQHIVLTLIGRPWLLIVLLSSIYASNTVLWILLLSMISRRGRSLSSIQTLMLVVWPKWLLLVCILASMVVSTVNPLARIHLVFGVFIVWILCSFYAHLRTLIDFRTITNVPLYGLLVPAVVRPSHFLFLILITLAIRFLPETTLLWHLIAYGT